MIVVCAPSRSSRRAMYIPILARPPVSSARLPVRSVRWSRLACERGGAVGAEPVVERVDERVVGLADVAPARVDELAGEGALGVGDQGDSLGLVVDPHRRAGGRRLDDLPVGLALGPRLRVAPVLLEPLVHQRRGALEGLEVGVVDLEPRVRGRAPARRSRRPRGRGARRRQGPARSRCHSPRKGTRAAAVPPQSAGPGRTAWRERRAASPGSRPGSGARTVTRGEVDGPVSSRSPA